jgi:adenylosuccinate lyase
VPLWHERDISHSSVERIILPDSCTLLDYMLVTLTKLVDRLLVYPENMLRNMELTGGLYASQGALLRLTEKGLERKVAYEAVQRAAMRTWKEKIPLAKTLAEEPEVAAKLSPEDVAEACALDHHFKHVEAKFLAVGLEP